MDWSNWLSRMPTATLSRVSSSGNAAAANAPIKQEVHEEEEEGAIPAFSGRAVSPSATPVACKSMGHDDDGDNGEDNQSNGTSGAVASGDEEVSGSADALRMDMNIMEAAGAGNEENNDASSNTGENARRDTGQQSGATRHEESNTNTDEKDIFLSLRDENYKDIITEAWGILWGESRKEKDGPNCADLATKIFDELEAEMESSGGRFYRSSTAQSGSTARSSRYRATGKEALKKIRADLSRGKFDYKHSIFSKAKKIMPDPRNSEAGCDVTPPAVSTTPLDGPTKMPAPRTTDKDLVVSLKVSDYQKIITSLVTSHVDNCLNGHPNDPLTTIASAQVEAVRKRGGRFFKHGYILIDDKMAQEKILRNLREKLGDARKDHVQIVVVNMKNERYKHSIKEGAKTLVQEKVNAKGSSRLDGGGVGITLLDKFKSSGAKHFFKNATDEEEITFVEALEKIIKDVEAQARGLRYGSGDGAPLVLHDGSNEDTFISSTRTRKRKSSEGPTIDVPPREFLSGYVQNILRDYGWRVREEKIKGVDIWVASRTENNAKMPTRLIGNDEILDHAYLNGIYEEYLVDTEAGSVGKDCLFRAGILEKPFSIFSDSLKQERKRRKQEQERTNSSQVESSNQMPMGMPGENINGSDDTSTSPTMNMNYTANETRASTHHESGTQSSGQAASVPDANPEGGTENSSEVNRNQRDSVVDQEGIGGTAQMVTNGLEDLNNPATAAEPPTNVRVLESQLNNQASSATRGQTEQGTETIVENKSSPHQGATAGSSAPGINQVRQMYKQIKTKLSDAKKRKHEKQAHGSIENGVKIETLQIEFFSYLKSWLAPRLKGVQDSDLNAVQILIDDFESDISDLEKAGNENDEDDMTFYTDCCEGRIGECKDLPL